MAQRPDNRRPPQRGQPERPEFELMFGKNWSIKCHGWRGFFLTLAVVLAAAIVLLVGAWVVPTKSSTVVAQVSSYLGHNQPKH